MLLVLIIFAFFALITWYQLKYSYRNSILAMTPAPKKILLINNMLEFLGKPAKELFDWLEAMSLKLGPVYQFTLDPFDNGTYIVSDTKVAEGILSSQKLINKGDDYELMKAWLGTGLLISTGKKWHQRRKIITPAFHFQILEKFVEIMEEQGEILLKKMEKFDGKEVDMFPLVNLYALDVICESAMGCSINAQQSDSDYVKAVKEIGEIIFERSFDTFRRIDFVYQFTAMYQREQQNLKILHGFTSSVIKARRQDLLSSVAKPESLDEKCSRRKMALLDILLQSTVDGEPLSDMDIREEVDTFMFEGHDTTTSGIAFCLYNIAKYPEVQKKIFNEIENNLGSGKSISLSDLNNLRYIDLVIKESLRLFPSVPYFARKLSDEVTFNGYKFPKGCSVYISPYLMGRDKKLFQNPKEFRPERFDVETTTEKVNPFCYIPFSAGPRNCIGQKFAMYELKSIICKIVRNFELSIKVDRDLELYSELVLKSAGGVKLTVKKRQLL